jgi:hypothetical protein
MKQTQMMMTFAFAAVLGAAVNAQSLDTPNPDLNASINRSAPARPAAKPAAPAARNNAARPAAPAARPNVSRPAAANNRPVAASRPAAANRPTSAHENSARPNTARAGNARPEAGRPSAGRESHPNVARGGEHAGGRPESHGAARNASYSHGGNLHGGNRIPEDRFRGSFGRGHEFRIGHPVMIGGQASFQFGGFWFGIVDPWPAAWLYTDAVYVDFINGGYVLVNVLHPEVQVAVSAGDPAPTTCATAEPVVPATPVVVTPVVAPRVVAVAVPAYPILTWHYWRHYWR